MYNVLNIIRNKSIFRLMVQDLILLNMFTFILFLLFDFAILYLMITFPPAIFWAGPCFLAVTTGLFIYSKDFFFPKIDSNKKSKSKKKK